MSASRAAEFEAFFIFKRDTLYHPTRRLDGCNQRNGDHAAAVDTAVEAEIAAGFKWPDNGCRQDVVESHAKVAMFEDLVAVFGDSTDLRLALFEAIEEKFRERASHALGDLRTACKRL